MRSAKAYMSEQSSVEHSRRNDRTAPWGMSGWTPTMLKTIFKSKDLICRTTPIANSLSHLAKYITLVNCWNLWSPPMSSPLNARCCLIFFNMPVRVYPIFVWMGWCHSTHYGVWKRARYLHLDSQSRLEGSNYCWLLPFGSSLSYCTSAGALLELARYWDSCYYICWK